jgi:hypothetical protein
MPGYWLQTFGGQQYESPSWDPTDSFSGYENGEIAMFINLGTNGM